VGQVSVQPVTRDEYLSAGQVRIEVLDETTGGHIPARISVLGQGGTLQSVGADSNEQLAVRPGMVSTSVGIAQFGLPEGEYTIYAGRGFEYSMASTKVIVRKGQQVSQRLQIRREVPTAGYVACDTHTHTLTHSGHGDSSVQERMITLAAEGVELPIATDHNVQIDQEPYARQMNVRQYFTPVTGNEVTTKTGHFNIFPVPADAGLPDHKSPDWADTFASIRQTTGAPVVILNHARDIHGGTRPFGPAHHNAAVAENLDGWPFLFSGMEVINSGATQTDAMQLFRDWMAVLNRGLRVTPVGCSDSHDVSRYLVGQGRTYIRCDDTDAGAINVAEAVDSFLAGRVMVSYGLLAELKVNEGVHGDTVKTGSSCDVSVRVLGPGWTTASRVALFANGRKIREPMISAADSPGPGIKWQGTWKLNDLPHDVHLTAIATGPGINHGWWKTARPYQPDSADWTAQVLGCSGAVWLDVDGDGHWSSARDYASGIVSQHAADTAQVAKKLADFDASVAAHTAYLLHQEHSVPPETLLQQSNLSQVSRQGIQNYLTAWQETQQHRSDSGE
jgi:hypothetical protein